MSEFNITIEGGTSKRLPVGNKWSEKDIIVTATGGSTPTPLQEKAIDIAANGTVNVVPDTGYALSKVTAKVNVPIPNGYIKPSGTKSITQNGEYNIASYENVSVEVQPEIVVPNIQPLEVTENGTYVVPDGVDGYSPVVVSVSNEPNYKELYQRVEYIESAEAGTYPYIITDFIGNNASGLEVIASFPTMQDRIPMGSRLDGNSTRLYCVYPLSSSSIYYGFDTGVTISCSLKTNTIYRLQTNFLNSRLVNVYDESGARKGGGAISETLTQQACPVAIFGYNSASSGNVTSKREFKLYGARCSQGHQVVREYLPCYRKSDGLVGVYEIITGQFLTAEVGSFAKGADIDWDTVL